MLLSYQCLFPAYSLDYTLLQDLKTYQGTSAGITPAGWHLVTSVGPT